MENAAKNSQKLEEQAIIPGLPADIAVNCLARVSRVHYSSMKCVCRHWRNLLRDRNSVIYHARIHQGFTEPSLLLVTTKPSSAMLRVDTKEVHLNSGKISKAECRIRRSGMDRCRNYAVVCTGTDLGILEDDPYSQGYIYTINIIDKELRSITSIFWAHVNYAFAVIDGDLYVVTGNYGEAFATFAHRYNFQTNSWSPVSTPPPRQTHPLHPWFDWSGTAVSGHLLVDYRLWVTDKYVRQTYSAQSSSWQEEALLDEGCKNWPYREVAGPPDGRGNTLFHLKKCTITEKEKSQMTENSSSQWEIREGQANFIQGKLAPMKWKLIFQLNPPSSWMKQFDPKLVVLSPNQVAVLFPDEDKLYVQLLDLHNKTVHNIEVPLHCSPHVKFVGINF